MVFLMQSMTTEWKQRAPKICDWLGEPWTYGNLAIICALDYASYRAGHLNWQVRAPKLAAWHAKFTGDAFYLATYNYPS